MYHQYSWITAQRMWCLHKDGRYLVLGQNPVSNKSKYSLDINTRSIEMLTICEKRQSVGEDKLQKKWWHCWWIREALDNRDPAEEKMKRFSMVPRIYSAFQLCAFHCSSYVSLNMYTCVYLTAYDFKWTDGKLTWISEFLQTSVVPLLQWQHHSRW